jgi:lipopolysaccharide transport system permease protein
MIDTTPTFRHYDAATARQGVLRHLATLPGYPEVIWRNRFLVANFFRRELLGRFRGSMLGVFWVLVQPVFMFVVYFLVFGMLFGNWKAGEPPDPNFAFYLFSGVIGFQALNEATTNSCSSVVSNGNLVKKVAFPSEVLPVETVLVSLVIYLVGALVCLASLAVCRLAGLQVPGLQPGWLLLALPLVLAVQFVMALGIGLFLANLYVFARDVRQLWGIFTMAWLFVSPVFWLPTMLEQKFGGFAPVLFALNPAYPLVMAQRLALGATDGPLQADGLAVHFGHFWSHLGTAALWGVAFLMLGYTTFMSRKHRYADLV